MVKPNKPNNKKTANKRNDAEKLADYLEIAILSHKGRTQAEIAKILSNNRPYTLSQQQISYDMKELKEIWRKDTAIDIDTEKGKIKSHIELLIKEAHQAWERSQESIITTTEGESKDARGESKDASFYSKQTREQVGDPRFIAEIRALLKEYRDLLGIDPPTKLDLLNSEPLTVIIKKGSGNK